jgi:hypothetical protein
MFWRGMNVTGRDADVAMSRNLLYGKGVCIGFGEPRECGVTEIVKPEAAFQVDLLYQAVVLGIDSGVCKSPQISGFVR